MARRYVRPDPLWAAARLLSPLCDSIGTVCAMPGTSPAVLGALTQLCDRSRPAILAGGLATELEHRGGCETGNHRYGSTKAACGSLRPMGPTMSFGYEGDGGLGDRLLAAVLRGEKTATSSLVVEYLSGEPLPRVGQRLTLVDHAGRAAGVVETTRVAIIPLSDVGDDVALDEGEGITDAADWRNAHVAYWTDTTKLIREDAGDPAWELRDNEPVVVQWFRRLDAAGSARA